MSMAGELKVGDIIKMDLGKSHRIATKPNGEKYRISQSDSAIVTSNTRFGITCRNRSDGAEFWLADVTDVEVIGHDEFWK